MKNEMMQNMCMTMMSEFMKKGSGMCCNDAQKEEETKKEKDKMNDHNISVKECFEMMEQCCGGSNKDKEK